MKFTGERVIPGQGDADLFNEHRARYLFARRFSAGKMVLDAACGSGYGSALLAENAKGVFGVDISLEAVDYARRQYESAQVHFAQCDCLALPFLSGQFDLVVAFEIIEHVPDAERFLKELSRVLNPSGLLLLSTPNRLYYTDEREEINPFHTREFSFPEFEETLQPLFPCRSILFENHVPGLLLSGPGAKPNFTSSSAGDIIQEETSHSGEDEQKVNEGSEKTAHYFLAICSAQPLDPVSPLLYLPTSGNALRERELHVRLLSRYLDEANAELEKSNGIWEARFLEINQLVEERTRWAAELEHQLKEKGADLLRLQADYDSKVHWALSTQTDLDRARGIIRELQSDVDNKVQWALGLQNDLDGAHRVIQELQADVESKVQWALSLQRDLERERGASKQLRDEFEVKAEWALTLQQELDQERTARQQLQREFEERTAWALRLNAELEQRNAELQERWKDLRVLYSSSWYRIGKTLRLSPVPPSDVAGGS